MTLTRYRMFGTVSYFLSYDCTDDNAYMQGSFSSALQEDMSAYISSQSADDVTTTVVVIQTTAWSIYYWILLQLMEQYLVATGSSTVNSVGCLYK